MHEKSIDLLNARGGRRALQAVHQYMYFHFHLRRSGVIALLAALLQAHSH
jgi:hypothetical protein